MKIKLNYSHLFAEFIIVFVGVAVALAADGWRQDYGDRNLEGEYLVRIANDLNVGQEQVQFQSKRFQGVKNAADEIVELAKYNRNTIDIDATFELLLIAGATGGTRANYDHDITYQELISTGRLNVITDPTIRSSLMEYYRTVDDIKIIRETFPRTLLNLFYDFAGLAPIDTDGGKLISPIDREIMIKELLDNEKNLQDLRGLSGRIIRYEVSSARAREQSAILLNIINSATGT